MTQGRLSIALLFVAALPGADATARGQSTLPGTVIVEEDFAAGSDAPNPREWSMKAWNVPDTWQLRDGAIAGIYDKAKLKAKVHGKSLNARLAAHDVRVSYRLKLEEPGSRVTMIVNAGMPKQTGSPIWHIGRVVARLDTEADVSIVEDGLTRDRNHPEAKGGPNTAPWQRNLDGADVRSTRGGKTQVKAGLARGQWHRFVVENVGTKWTVWVDGAEVAAAMLGHSDVDKESVNFLSNGSVFIDDIVVEKL